ncbi:tripartite motif-containing protein 16-like [Centropristis striata]|uniref:tripartite motif-containing protein 16-like n=1 Tax=Centropristis striata TaxID=184440 RepID=UPI0027E111E8|nr:tripartite motif-containing protein 16-like [Centropristis striata]
MTERQKNLGVSRQEIQQRIQNREKDVKLLLQEVEAVNRSADKAVEDSEKIFRDAKHQIRSRQKSEVTHMNKLQEKLQQEITELKRRDLALEQLLHTEDHNQFLHDYIMLSRLTEATDSPSINIRPLSYTEDVAAAVSEVQHKLQDVLSEEWTRTSLTRTGDVSPPQAEPKTRDDFLRHSCQITPDRNTAHKHMNMDYWNSCKVAFQFNRNPHYDHPDSFTDWCQGLCREGLTGRCYWEVKWEGRGVFVAVAYKSINRKGDESLFGHNHKSWALQCFPDGYEYRHNNIITPISGPQSSTVGVYLDHSAGTLSFYSVSETMTLLHRAQTTFTQPLCPGFGLHAYGASAVICRAPNTEEEEEEQESLYS